MIYHISSSTGNDNNDGLTPETPWRTLARASALKLSAGDKLLLKCGDIWEETLSPKGDGTPDQPIIVSSYGAGARPYIHKRISDVEDRCIQLDRVQGYRLIGLELGMARYGVEIIPDRAVREFWDYYYFEDCYFHDIINTSFPHTQANGTDLTGWPWAIYRRVDAIGAGHVSQGCIFKNTTVKNCFADRNQGFYSCQYMDSGEKCLYEKDTLFDGITLQNGYFNNIYQCCAENFVIKNSVLVYSWPNENEWRFGNSWVIAGSPTEDNCYGLKFTGNEIGWAGDVAGSPVDGCFYDMEFSSVDTVISNNLMHNAIGEAVLTMRDAIIENVLFDGNIIRSVDEYCKNRTCAIEINNRSGGIYSNNRIFIREGQSAFKRKPEGYDFVNNDENAAGDFVEMPLVSEIVVGAGKRTYSFVCPTEGATLRYTADCSLPTSGSALYERPITVDRSCVINVKAFKSGMYDSYVNSALVDFRNSEGCGPVLTGKPTKDDASAMNSISDDFTVAFWAKPEAPIQMADESGGGPDSGHANVEVSVGTNGVAVFERGDGYFPTVLVDRFAAAGWIHIAVVYRNRQPLLFINGIPKKTGFKSSKTVHPNFSADVLLYDRPLTNAEIQILFNRRSYHDE